MRDAVLIFAPADLTFARRLNEALVKHGYTTWVRWETAAPSNDTWVKFYDAIERADNALVIVSPEAVVSETVREAVDYATRLHKRLIPIIRRDANVGALNTLLQGWPWIFFRENEDFHAALLRVQDAISDDQQYVRAHTDLLLRSGDWELQWRKPRFLLRGADLRGAESWLAKSASHAVKPVDRQTEYILASRRAARAARRRALAAILVAFMATVVLAGVALIRLLSPQILMDSILLQTPGAEATALANTAAVVNSRVDTAQAQGSQVVFQTQSAVEDEANRLATQARAGEERPAFRVTATQAAASPAPDALSPTAQPDTSGPLATAQQQVAQVYTQQAEVVNQATESGATVAALIAAVTSDAEAFRATSTAVHDRLAAADAEINSAATRVRAAELERDALAATAQAAQAFASEALATSQAAQAILTAQANGRVEQTNSAEIAETAESTPEPLSATLRRFNVFQTLMRLLTGSS